MFNDIVTILHELKLGMPAIIQDIAEEILRDSIIFELQIRNCGFTIENFLFRIGIPDRCISSMSLVLNDHGYLDPDSISSLNRNLLKDMDFKVGLRVKLLRGVVILRYLGYGSQLSG